ncbi:MAG: DUF4915 domain-containing protein [Xenococcaceae cyanobacterium MO_234.B1]|nr:DUF4915 domain-containing protein [Xenococcaceae cyanobacterium MO_234.B1]
MGELQLKEKDGEARCGLMVVDLKTGAIAHWVRIEGRITELYDVQVIPGVKRPMALGFQTKEIAQLIALEPLEAVGSNDCLIAEKPNQSSSHTSKKGFGKKTTEKRERRGRDKKIIPLAKKI